MIRGIEIALIQTILPKFGWKSTLFSAGLSVESLKHCGWNRIGRLIEVEWIFADYYSKGLYLPGMEIHGMESQAWLQIRLVISLSQELANKSISIIHSEFFSIRTSWWLRSFLCTGRLKVLFGAFYSMLWVFLLIYADNHAFSEHLERCSLIIKQHKVLS